MRINEILQNVGGANVTVTIGLKDLQEWHDELMVNKLDQNEPLTSEKSDHEYYSPIEVCSSYGVSRSTLERWKTKGYLIPSKLGGRCKYLKSEIDSILNKKMK